MKRRRLKIGIYTCITVALVYVLSEGLAYRLFMKQVLPSQVFTTVYQPIIYSCHHSTIVDRFFTWYEMLWYDEAADFLRDITEDLKKDGIMEKK
jgi:hypothetical protein